MLLACVPFVFHFNPDWRWVYVIALYRASSPIVAAPETLRLCNLRFVANPAGIPCRARPHPSPTFRVPNRTSLDGARVRGGP